MVTARVVHLTAPADGATVTSTPVAVHGTKCRRPACRVTSPPLAHIRLDSPDEGSTVATTVHVEYAPVALSRTGCSSAAPVDLFAILMLGLMAPRRRRTLRK